MQSQCFIQDGEEQMLSDTETVAHRTVAAPDLPEMRMNGNTMNEAV